MTYGPSHRIVSLPKPPLFSRVEGNNVESLGLHLPYSHPPTEQADVRERLLKRAIETGPHRVATFDYGNSPLGPWERL